MRSQLTELLAKKYRDSGLRIEIWDTLLTNFYLQVRETGKASYYIRYTTTQGKKKTFRLGDAAVLNVSEARKLARQKLALALTGDNLGRTAAVPAISATLAEIVEERYLPLIKQTKKSWFQDDSALRCHILPALGEKPIAEITTDDISRLMYAMRRGGKGGAPKGRSKIPYPAGEGYSASACNRVRILMNRLFKLVIEEWKLPGVSENPAQRVRTFTENPRQTFLTPGQIQQLLEAGLPQHNPQNLHTLSIVMLLVLTGVRKSNALKARWQEFDEARGLWNVPKTKAGKSQSIPLADEVLKLLLQLPSRTHSPYLFPNPLTGRPYESVYGSWNAMRQRAGLRHVRMHDLRHTFASLLINGGASLFMVQNALGHSDPKMTMRYAHLAESTQRQAIRAAAAQWPCEAFLRSQ